MLQGSVSPALALATPRQCERFTPLRKVHGRTSRIVSRPSRCTRPWRAEGLLCHAEGGSHASDTSAARYEAVQRQLAKSQRAQARALKRRLLNQLLKEIEVMEQYLAPELLQCQVQDLIKEVEEQQTEILKLQGQVETISTSPPPQVTPSPTPSPQSTPAVYQQSPQLGERHPMSSAQREWVSLPARLILVRHAESRGNVDESTYTDTPDWKVPLSDRGQEQAEAAGQTICDLLEEAHGDDYKLSVYCSPYERCVQTMNGILESFPASKIESIRQEVQLREQDFGNFQDLEETKKEKAERLRYGRFFYRFPHGESGADVYNRMTMMEDELVRDLRAGCFDRNTSILVVSHGLSVRIMLMNWFRWTVDECNAVYNPPNATPLVLERIAGPLDFASQMDSDSDGGLNMSWVKLKAMYRLSADTVQVLQGVTDGMRMLNAKPKMLSTLDDGNE